MDYKNLVVGHYVLYPKEMLLPWVFGGVIAIIVLLAMIRDARRDGMLETKRDAAYGLACLGSLAGIGAGAWLIAPHVLPDHPAGGAIALFFIGVLCVKMMLDIVVRIQGAKRMRQNGILTRREFNQKADAVLARIRSAQ